MKRLLQRFTLYFLGVFIIIIIFGAIFKPSDLNYEGIVRAIVLSTSFAVVSLFGEYRKDRKNSKK